MTNAEKIVYGIDSLFYDWDDTGIAVLENRDGKEIICIVIFVSEYDTYDCIAEIDGETLQVLKIGDREYDVFSLSLDDDIFQDGFSDKYKHLCEIEEKVLEDGNYIFQLSEDDPAFIDYCKLIVEEVYYFNLLKASDEIRPVLSYYELIHNLIRKNTTFDEDFKLMMEYETYEY